ncbi:basic amino acid ABC transporter substrate-binding protein [Bacillaceae bacterium Marseille-Q3522]|nr:basic amino acid ABC transporter substrate-binding protein [Bacillaceae bacterium Marseille-Q3522]
MKRKIMFFLTLLVFLLAACGTGNDSQNSGESGSEGELETLRVVTDAAYAPFEYMDKGEVTGFDVDFLEAVAKEAGYNAEIENVGWEAVFAEIGNKTADLAVSAITITDDRKKDNDFSVPYYLSTNKILVPEDSDIKSAADLEGKTVAVQTGTTGQEAVEAILGANNPNIKMFENTMLAIMQLQQNGADAVVADNTVVEEYAKNNPDANFKVIEDTENFAAEYYGLMFPKGSELVAKFNDAINAVYDNGTYADLYEEWFGVEPDIEKLKAEQ